MSNRLARIRSMRLLLFATSLLVLRSVAASPLLNAEQEQKIRAHLDNGDFIGLAVVSVAGELIEHRSFGRASVDRAGKIARTDQFEIGSITKAFTNLLLAELVAREVVSYDTTIAELMTDVAFANPDVAKITLLQLATHTSGLPRLPANLLQDDPADPYKDYDVAALRQGIEATRAGQQLIKRYAYSNFGVGLLGHLLGVADGTNYQQALQSHVLAPLGMTTATFEDTRDLVTGHHEGRPTSNWHLQALAAAGALRASGVELAKILQPWLSDNFEGLQHDPAADLLRAASAGGNIGVTRVWHVVGEGDKTIYWHNGGTGGYRSYLGFNPVSRTALILLTNSEFNVTKLGLQLLKAAPVDRGKDSDGSAAGRQPDYSDYYGHFAITPTFVLSVFDLQGQLVVQATAQPPLRLAASGDDVFTLMDVDAQLAFERDASGAVQRAVLHQNGKTMPGKRVDAPVATRTFSEIDIDPNVLADYTGIFKLAARVLFRVTEKNDQLMVRLTDQSALPVFPFEQDRFFYKGVDAQLTFNRENGEIVSLTLHQNGIDQIAPKK